MNNSEILDQMELRLERIKLSYFCEQFEQMHYELQDDFDYLCNFVVTSHELMTNVSINRSLMFDRTWQDRLIDLSEVNKRVGLRLAKYEPPPYHQCYQDLLREVGRNVYLICSAFDTSIAAIRGRDLVEAELNFQLCLESGPKVRQNVNELLRMIKADKLFIAEKIAELGPIGVD